MAAPTVSGVWITTRSKIPEVLIDLLLIWIENLKFVHQAAKYILFGPDGKNLSY